MKWLLIKFKLCQVMIIIRIENYNSDTKVSNPFSNEISQSIISLQNIVGKQSWAATEHLFAQFLSMLAQHGNGNASLTNRLEMAQRKAARWILNKWQHTDSPTQMLKESYLDTIFFTHIYFIFVNILLNLRN